ncbi:MAG TPA: hypothetical protein VGP93_03965, partial [Polyangiaceae bacterium]|nr:hypothetical protein [Polyangiaceae bacterium]
KVVELAAGDTHTCALLEGGQMRCWGNGYPGQLGYGDTENIGDDETPASVGTVDVGGSVVELTTATAHTCALLEGGKVRCWGAASAGELGYASSSIIGDDETPASAGDVDVGGDVMQVRANGYRTCALLADFNIRCWGKGDEGALGYGNTDTIGDDETPSSAGDVSVTDHPVF